MPGESDITGRVRGDSGGEMGKWIKKRGERSPDAGCRLDPLVTKNKSLFSGVGEGSLVKSTNLHTHTHR